MNDRPTLLSERALRAILAFVALFHIALGGLALIAPDTFFEQIGTYGIENSHYVGDVGAFTTAFGIAVGISVWRASWRPAILWLGAVWYALHAVNHAFDTGEAKSEGRGWADTISIAFGAVGAAWLARVAERLNAARSRTSSEEREVRER